MTCYLTFTLCFVPGKASVAYANVFFINFDAASIFMTMHRTICKFYTVRKGILLKSN